VYKQIDARYDWQRGEREREREKRKREEMSKTLFNTHIYVYI